MLDFFRKYQRYFFLVITIVIIISFSFFGTYSTLGSNRWREQIAFKAIDGHEVSRSDLDEMATFLATDNQDKILFGGAWGPNFLNDGVIQKDFLDTGLAEQLVAAYPNDVQEDLNKRLGKEKKYKLYAHPKAPFLGIEGIWSYFSPDMNTHFKELQMAQNGADPVAFDNRIKLYLGQKQISPPMMRQILLYQEQQYRDWLKPDERLSQIDLSLYGYHTIEDWFGPAFTRLISEFIINAAILAEEKGYQVSTAEVLTDLVRNTQVSYQQNINNPNLGVTSPEEYLSEQLRRLNIDQSRAIKIWRQVLLFRRYFQDAGTSALVDALVTEKMDQFANESVSVDLYRLPIALRMTNSHDMENFEAYLYAVAKQDKNDPLAIPQEFLPIATIEKKYPELIQKRYVLEVSKVSLKTLQARIGLRQLWSWETEEKNWGLLKKQFPTLAVHSSKTTEERFEALEGLEPAMRSVVDAFAKQQIIKEHPEWVVQALNDAKPETLVVGLRLQGGTVPFTGHHEKEAREQLIALLDKAPIGMTVPVDSPLYDYSADGQTYYRIAVLERAEEQEIVSFEEAKSDGTLDVVRDRILEQYYLTIRAKDSSLYQNDNKEWKPLKEVHDSVADQFFKKLNTSLDGVHQEILKKEANKEGLGKEGLTKDKRASIRLYPYLNKVKEGLVNGSSDVQQSIKAVPVEPAGESSVEGDVENGDGTGHGNQEDRLNRLSSKTLSHHSSLGDQWKIEKTTVSLNRQTGESGLSVSEALSLKENVWSPINTPVNGDLAFYQVKSHDKSGDKGQTQEKEKGEKQLADQLEQARAAQSLIGAEAQRHLMEQVLTLLKSKQAISLAYLRMPMEENPAQGASIEPMDPGY